MWVVKECKFLRFVSVHVMIDDCFLALHIDLTQLNLLSKLCLAVLKGTALYFAQEGEIEADAGKVTLSFIVRTFTIAVNDQFAAPTSTHRGRDVLEVVDVVGVGEDVVAVRIVEALSSDLLALELWGF